MRQKKIVMERFGPILLAGQAVHPQSAKPDDDGGWDVVIHVKFQHDTPFRIRRQPVSIQAAVFEEAMRRLP